MIGEIVLLMATTLVASTGANTATALGHVPAPATMDDIPPPPPHLVLRVGAAPYYMRVFSVETYGGEGFISAGGASGERLYWGARFHLGLGRTANDLDIYRWRVDWFWEWAFDRLRVGFAPSFEYFSMESITYITDFGEMEPQERRRQFAPGIEVHGSIDLIHTRDHALFLAPSFYAVWSSWAPMLTVGYRFESRH